MGIEKDISANGIIASTMEKSERIPCATCKGTGKVVSHRGAICMEPVEKIEKCPDCNGKGHL